MPEKNQNKTPGAVSPRNDGADVGASTKRDQRPSPVPVQSPVCGIVMPIGPIGGLGPEHWKDVRLILEESARKADFDPKLVSEADEVGIIQRRIITNIYENPIVVCDVSCKNPNVMFELGMRLAFDRPVVIVKDDETDYSFDTAPIEHLSYPRDLRYQKIIDFEAELAAKIAATAKAPSGADYTSFLKHFGPIQVAEIPKKDVSEFEFLRSELSELRRLILRTTERVRPPAGFTYSQGDSIVDTAVNNLLTSWGLKRKLPVTEETFLDFLQSVTAEIVSPGRFFPSPGDFRASVRRSLSRYKAFASDIADAG